MSSMPNLEAIKYWVYTTRAPCLYGYDRVSRRRFKDILQKSEPQQKVTSLEDLIVCSPKKKKIKRFLIFNNSASSTSSQENLIYFEKSSQTNNKKALTTLISEETVLTKSCLNVKNYKGVHTNQSINEEDVYHNGNRNPIRQHNIVTSTPLNHKNHLNGDRLHEYDLREVCNNKDSFFQISKRSTSKDFHSVKHRTHDYDGKKIITSNNKVQNGAFDDLSDISGLTANYIRSTKLMSAKNKKQTVESRKISKRLNMSNLRNGIKEFSPNECSHLFDNSKNLIKKVHKHQLKKIRTENSDCSEVNDIFFSVTDYSISRDSVNIASDISKSHKQESKYQSSSDNESIFGIKSRSNIKKNKSLNRKKRRIQKEQNFILTNNNSLYNKNQINEHMFHRPKRSILSLSNSKEPGRLLPKNGNETIKKYNVAKAKILSLNIKGENGVEYKNPCTVSQNKTKNNSSTNIYFSDSDSDISNEGRKYFNY